MCYRPKMQEFMYINKLHEVEQINREMSWVHTVCNQTKAKVNVRNTVLLIFILHFLCCPNPFWCGVVYRPRFRKWKWPGFFSRGRCGVGQESYNPNACFVLPVISLSILLDLLCLGMAPVVVIWFGSQVLLDWYMNYSILASSLNLDHNFK